MGDARVGVFIDYMNSYNHAREAFFPASPHFLSGQFQPAALAHRIVDRDSGRALQFVRAYRGMPDPRANPKGNRACQREIVDWKAARVVPVTRPVRVNEGVEREKGIDVKLAIDLLLGALRSLYDVAVVMSNDNDLVPAIEAVDQVAAMMKETGRPGPAVEVAAWKPEGRPANQLRLDARRLRCHLLTIEDYRAVENPRDYTR